MELLERQLLVADRASVLSTGSQDSETNTIVPGVQQEPTDYSSEFADGHYPNREFEQSLLASWVYRRNQHRDEDMSLRGSVCRMSCWSALSDLSMADISVLSVLALPISIDELHNGSWYRASLEGDVPGADCQPSVEPQVAVPENIGADENGQLEHQPWREIGDLILSDPLPSGDDGDSEATTAGPRGKASKNSSSESNDEHETVYSCKACGEVLPSRSSSY